MADVTVDLPEDVYVRFEQIVDEEFVSEQEAVEELLAAGLEAYDTSTEDDASMSEEYAEEMWDTVESHDERDPDAGGSRGDERSF